MNAAVMAKLRDLGGVDLLEAFEFERTTYWLYCPLLDRDHPAHPLWRLEFMLAARHGGVYEAWSRLVVGWHTQCVQLGEIRRSPVWSLHGGMAGNLLVHHLMEPVEVI